jgi:hypothetical protein
VGNFQAKINETFSPKTVIAKLLTWKQRGKLEGPDRGGEWKKERVKERGKGMTWGQRIKRVRVRVKERRKEKRRRRRGRREGKKGRKEGKRRGHWQVRPRKEGARPAKHRQLPSYYNTGRHLVCFVTVLYCVIIYSIVSVQYRQDEVQFTSMCMPYIIGSAEHDT